MTIALRFGLCLAFLSFCLMNIARAQELDKLPPAETNVADRVRLLESELERQNSKLDQLQKTLLEQQQTIQALIEKLTGEKTAAVANAKESETSTTVTAAPAEAQAPTAEQRLAKVEGQVLKVGPVRVSGDFRLRYDGIFRSATDPSDPP